MLYVRADGNSKIGMGHIMRCVSIVGELMKRGLDVKFLIASQEPADVLKNAKIPYIILETDYTNMEEETEPLSRILQKGDKILVDSYYVTVEYFEYLKKFGKVIYIDDVHSFEYPVDMVINGNIYGDREKYQAGTVLGGCKYSPLKREYKEAKKFRKPENILVTTGSSDPYKITEKLVDVILLDEVLSKQKINIICGKYNKSYEVIKHLTKQNPNIEIFQNVSDMWEYMKNAMLAITAGGTTMTELSCMGVPIVCFSFVENQDRIVKTFVEDGYAHYGGFYAIEKENLVQNICTAAKELVMNDILREQYAVKLMELVDGRGCERIAEEIINLD